MILSRDHKEEWRQTLALLPGGQGPPEESWGRLAQRLRAMEEYRRAKRVFVGPAAILAQIRINVLLDGKELVMPAPGLKEGFYLCRPYVIPFTDLGYATTYKGLPKFGRLLDNRALAKLPVDLLVTDAKAVDRQGGRLGDGQGFFDLTCAILAELGVLDPGRATIMAVAGDQQLVDELPTDPWDVRLHGLITPASEYRFSRDEGGRPTLLWQYLPLDRVRRFNPLWRLHGERRAE